MDFINLQAPLKNFQKNKMISEENFLAPNDDYASLKCISAVI